MRSQCIHLALRDQFCYHATQNSLNPLKNFSGFGLVSTTDPGRQVMSNLDGFAPV